ncbi:hydroxyacylglutathione hydrolase [Scheffersomyces coipomensis]|uniref:hydroxyacylglutathione hydrolase n=1 Tax=Scheffersomyces coipomensis TaxID=1788519 RepID=UPI00315CDEB7
MHIESIPMRWGSGNNYAYLLIDTPTKHAWLIDAAEPEEVTDYIKLHKPNFELKAIVNTHHHYDHAGGNKDWHGKYPDLPIIAGKDAAHVSYTPSHKEVIDLGDDLSITALHTPCHTQDSICYYVVDSKTKDKAVFTGDTLFTSGCGRFFEGTGEEMDQALNHILGKLPKETKVYSGHEYTASNVKFSKTILNNDAIKKLEKFANENEYTTGVFTIGDELEFNPFMRLHDPIVQKKTGYTTSTDVMTKLRELKNSM